MRIKTLHEFSGVPKGTTGIAERDDIDNKIEYKITWDLVSNCNRITKPLIDYFDEDEFKKYLVKI